VLAFLSAFHHATGGPLYVQNPRIRTPIMNTFLEAGEYLGYQIEDPNGAVQNGKL